MESAATCTETGQKKFTCTDCGEEKTETIDATGHSWGEETVIKEATCTEAGESGCFCTVCGVQNEETTTIEALGHNLIESAEESVAATEKQDGCKVFLCNRTGCTYREEEVIHFALDLWTLAVQDSEGNWSPLTDYECGTTEAPPEGAAMVQFCLPCQNADAAVFVAVKTEEVSKWLVTEEIATEDYTVTVYHLCSPEISHYTIDVTDEAGQVIKQLYAGGRSCCFCGCLFEISEHQVTQAEDGTFYCNTCGETVQLLDGTDSDIDWCGLCGHQYPEITENTEVTPAGCEDPYQWVLNCALCGETKYVPVTTENLPADFPDGESFVAKYAPQGHTIQWTLRYIPDGESDWTEVDPTDMFFAQSELDGFSNPDITLTGTCVNKDALTGEDCARTEVYDIIEANGDDRYFSADESGYFSFNTWNQNVFLEHLE